MSTFVLGLLMVALTGDVRVIQALYDPDRVYQWVPKVMSLLPFFNLAKAVADINECSKNQSGFYTWNDLQRAVSFNKTQVVDSEHFETRRVNVAMPSPQNAYFWLLGNIILFAFLAWYLDAALGEGGGQGRDWLFLFKPGYWGMRPNSTNSSSNPADSWRGGKLNHEIPRKIYQLTV